MPPTASVEPYDALLVVSFGGPEQPEDVLPFLENVTSGRGIPRERLEEVGQHYFEFGGRSPINDQCRALIAAVRADLLNDGIDLPIYWGNRNWDPFLTDTMARMSADGVRRAAAFVTSAYSSYSGCRQYREDLFRAVDATDGAPRIDKLRHYFNHPGFVTAFVDSAIAALERLPAGDRATAPLVFVTHSIPETMAASAGPDGGAYVQQHRSVASLVATGVAERTGEDHPWELAYCSRSGSPRTPWLEPDVNDYLQMLSDDEVRAVVTVPIGFVSDHMEVIYDLDTEAASTAARLGLGFARAATPGTSPPFVSMVRELLVERAQQERGEQTVPAALGDLGRSWNECEVHCCANPSGPQPALCQPAAASPVSP